MRVVPLALVAVIAFVPSLARAEVALPAATALSGELDAMAPPSAGALGPVGSAPDGLSGEAGTAGFGHWRGTSRWGFALGAGFPDFVTASLMVRPVAQVRVWAGPSWNYLAFGFQGGVALVPWRSWIAPVVALEAGRFFRSDLSFLAKDSGGVPDGTRSLLEAVDYSYAALDVGFDFGSARGFSLGVRFGLSYVSIAANGTATFESDSGSGAQVRISDPAFHGTLPSAKLALQYWF